MLISDLDDTSNDPLALRLRSELRGFKLNPTVKVVYSHEKPVVKLAALDKAQEAEPSAFGAIPGMRIRVMPVLGTTPAIFGMVAASEVLRDNFVRHPRSVVFLS